MPSRRSAARPAQDAPIAGAGPASRPNAAAAPRAERAASPLRDAATAGLPGLPGLEAAFGQDLADVRVALGMRDVLAPLGADAIAGDDWVAFSDRSPDRRQVAHEVAHVVQHRQAGAAPTSGMSRPGDAAERDAEAAADAAVAGERADVTAAPTGALQRDQGGFWSGLKALWGDPHLRDYLPEGSGLTFDDRDPTANRLDYELNAGATDEVLIPRLRLSSASAAGLTVNDLSADGLRLRQTAQGAASSATLTLGPVRAGALAGFGVSATGASAATITVRRTWKDGASDTGAWVKEFFSSPGTTLASVSGLTVDGLTAGDTRLDRLTASTVAAQHDADGTVKLGAPSLVGTGLTSGQPGSNGSTVDALSATGVSATLSPGVDPAFTANGAALGGLHHVQPGLDARVTSAKVGKLQHGPDGTTASGLAVTGLAAKQWEKRGQGDPALMKQIVALVQDVQLAATVDLATGTHFGGLKKVTIDPGTTATLAVTVQGGRLVPAGTHVRVDGGGSLDTFAFTRVRGLYVTSSGQVLMDVSLWKDLNLSQALGGTKDGVALDLPAALQGLGSTPPTGTGPDPSTLVDRVHTPTPAPFTLGQGTLTTGGTTLTMPKGNQGTLSVDVTSPGDDQQRTRLGLSFTRLLLSSLGLSVGDTDVTLEGVVGTNVNRSQVDTDKGSTVTTTSVGDLRSDRVTAR